MLSKETEKSLIERAQAGDAEAEAELVQRLDGHVRSVARMRATKIARGDIFEDLISAGVVGLIEATRRFDLSRDVQLWTYARTQVAKRMAEVIEDAIWSSGASHRTKRLGARVSKALAVEPDAGAARLAEMVGSTVEKVQAVLLAWEPTAPETDALVIWSQEDGPEAQAIAAVSQSVGELLAETLGDLDELARSVLLLRFGVGRDAPGTVAEVAEETGLSPDEVVRTEVLALADLTGLRRAS